MDQAPTGITSFDVPEMLKPMSDCVQSVQDRINRSKLLMLAEMHRDPVPQFSAENVKSATQFLSKAGGAMQSIIDGFKAESLATADEDAIKIMQSKCRESARKLVLLFGESGSKFQGDHMKGQLVSIQESSQVQEVRERLASLKSFFDTFATANWMGQLFAMQDFRKEFDIVLGLLNGLLNPQRALLDNVEVQVTVTKVNNELSAVAQKLQQLQQERGRRQNYGCYNQYNQTHSTKFPETPPEHLHGSARKEWSDLWVQWRHLHTLWGTRPNPDHGHCHVKVATRPNPLSAHVSVTTSEFTSKPLLEQLTNMCSELRDILQEDERKKHEMQTCLQVKMSNLADFAKVLNGIAGIVKRYVLTHLADIGKDDLSIVKKWITEEEATEVHQTLEAFRDDAIEELATRRAMNKILQKKQSDGSWQFAAGSDSAASMKEYLFRNSVGYAQGEKIEEVSEGNECGDDLGHDNDKDNNPGHSSKQKLSKHQRERRAKFRSTIPRTPSDVTCRS